MTTGCVIGLLQEYFIAGLIPDRPACYEGCPQCRKFPELDPGVMLCKHYIPEWEIMRTRDENGDFMRSY